MGFLDKLFDRRYDVHVHLHIDGAVSVDRDGLHEAIEGISKVKEPKKRFTPRKSPQIEPTLGNVQIPVVDFGEQVNDE